MIFRYKVLLKQILFENVECLCLVKRMYLHYEGYTFSTFMFVEVCCIFLSDILI